jgi:hypothetical protein
MFTEDYWWIAENNICSLKITDGILAEQTYFFLGVGKVSQNLSVSSAQLLKHDVLEHI